MSPSLLSEVPMIRQKLLIAILLVVSLVSTPAVSAQAGSENEAVSRMLINNAEVMLDAGAVFEALAEFRAAFDLSNDPRNQQDALLAEANILGWFLDEPEQALVLYRKGVGLFPELEEVLRYRAAMLMFEAGDEKLAREEITGYLRGFPDGQFRYQLEGVLQAMRREKIVSPAVALPVSLPIMRVGLSTGTKRIRLAATGNKLCIDGQLCRDSLDLKNRSGKVVADGIVLGEQVVVRSKSPISIELNGHKKTVLGSLQIVARSKKLIPVNHIDIESYLRSVVPAEVFASWPLEALKSQAVAARSYAYSLNRHGRANALYHLLADERSQMYAGITMHDPRTDRAVRETTGTVLSHGGKIAYTQYSAHSGGVTAESKAVFNVHKPYLVSHPDPVSMEARREVWSKSFSLAEIEKRLYSKRFPYVGIKRIEPERIGPSGRVIAVRISHSKGSDVVNTRASLLRALNLRDILMTITREGNGYRFEGAGFGHGVGMSQWGACGMGKTHSHAQILDFYYPGTQLKKLWK